MTEDLKVLSRNSMLKERTCEHQVKEVGNQQQSVLLKGDIREVGLV